MWAFSRELQSFVVVARENSIRQAAEKLNVSASALSRQMQILERSLGITLFVRDPQGIQITERGRLLLGRMEKWAMEGDVLKSSLRLDPAKEGKQFRIGIMECLVPHAIPLLELTRTYPGCRLQLTIGNTRLLTTLLKRNELDASIAFNVPPQPHIRIHTEKEFLIGLAHGHTMIPEGTRPYRLEDCLKWPICLPDRSLQIFTRLEAEINRCKSDANIVSRTNSFEFIKLFVASGKGVAFATHLDVSSSVKRGDFLFSEIASYRLSQTLQLCSSRHQNLEPPMLGILERFWTTL
ncbi:LysR family transcriptional regulator [Mesorhizobium sp. SP-1A]|uniref:LysR family transcriptional regulator n=1 Tax=Mesorhizobium sp. SP-1A TaxID=3077840 RepID=UPI0028F6C6EA|nr:LysR family transcriptional regulator [Mesorhizobium sp. SP-1A]